MKKTFIALCFTASCSIAFTQTSNPLLAHSNGPTAFKKIDAPAIHQATDSVIHLSDKIIDKITKVPLAKRNISNTLMATDELVYNLYNLSFKLGLIASTYEDDSTRNAANDESSRLGVYLSNILLNEGLYKSLISFSQSSVAKSLNGEQKKFLSETIVSFEKNGMKLDAAGKKKLQALNEKLINLGVEFDRNLAESKDSIVFTKAELAGVSENTILPWKRDNGTYVVRVNGPNYIDILKNASNENTRKQMLLKYNNRAYPANIKTLDSLLYYRNEFAQTLGFSSYAAYAVKDKMAKTPANVWGFENDLTARLAPHVTKELNDMKELKHLLDPAASDTIYAWDYSYYQKKLLDTKYNLNTDEVKEYFEMENTLKGMFTVYEKLFNIKITETPYDGVWQKQVKAYTLSMDGKKMGDFYLDLYPRANKYTHFACFPITPYRKINGVETLPVAALICNFREGNANEPSLIEHSDVVTLFHEFGHLVHGLLGRSEIASLGPFDVKGDFVEAPSQFLENWCWEYASLKLFAKNYKTGQPLPESLFNKMKATQMVNIAIQYMRQVYLGVLDFTYEDKYDSIRSRSLLDVSKDLYAITQTPYPEGLHFIANFTHLNGYGANYYGYLWSKVFAQDMFSEFQKNGVMDSATGIRYRKEILQKAATLEETEMLRNFLGREPNSKAFMKSIGLN